MVAHAMDGDVVVAAAEHADAGEARDVVLAAQRRLLHAVHLCPPPTARLLCTINCQLYTGTGSFNFGVYFYYVSCSKLLCKAAMD